MTHAMNPRLSTQSQPEKKDPPPPPDPPVVHPDGPRKGVLPGGPRESDPAKK